MPTYLNVINQALILLNKMSFIFLLGRIHIHNDRTERYINLYTYNFIKIIYKSIHIIIHKYILYKNRFM